MDFAILGPLEVRDGDGTVEVAGAKLRTLLATLLVHRGEVVSADRLADGLWGERQPVNPRNALQSQVAQLRRTLGTAGRELLVSRDPGYLLAIAPEQLDAERFERLLTAAAAVGDPDARAAHLRDALALWRGPALDGLADSRRPRPPRPGSRSCA